MSSNRTTASRKWLSSVPIGLGVLKVYLHYTSPFRYGAFDYFVAAGAVLGGVFLLFQKPLKAILPISFFFIIVEALKAVVDHHDPYDVIFTIIAISFLSIPFWRLLASTRAREESLRSSIFLGFVHLFNND